MIFDKQTLFSDDQAVTDTAASTNVIDLGALGTVSGPAGGTPPKTHYKGGSRGRIVCRVSGADFVDLTSLVVSVQVDDDVAFGTVETVLTSETFLAAALVKGKVLLDVQIPARVNKRYIRLNYTVDGTATAGKVTAGIIHDEQVNL
jgi:hypothetical protein